jgi:hypothetical protein
MDILLIILASIAGFLTFLLILALFLKKEYTMEKEIVINKSSQEVFDYLKLLKNQKYYNKWVMMDPNMITQDKGTDGTEGFFSAWDSGNKDLGKGEQTIKKLVNGRKIELELHFIKPFDSIAQAIFELEPLSANKTNVKWSFTGGMKYPMNLMLGLSKMIIGKALTEGLGNLKNILEK